jgi:glycosyltransferase involved in cell wall biosynthesis
VSGDTVKRSEALEAPALVSVLILTKDEEINIEACLRCFEFTDDVVVLDSFSTDRTVEIAGRFPNVRVVQRAFDTESMHLNWALSNIRFKHRWLYRSDADERVPTALRDEILGVVRDETCRHSAFSLRYQNMFLGRWIRHGGIYPVRILRLFRPDAIRYEDREINAHPIVDGSIGELAEHFVHYSFNKGLVPWFRKHNVYSQLEAHEAARVVSSDLRTQINPIRFGRGSERRRALKNLSFFLPLRGLVRFVYMYLFRLGVLDGAPGFHYCAMISMYEYWIELKLREQRSEWRSRTDRLAEKMLIEA